MRRETTDRVNNVQRILQICCIVVCCAAADASLVQAEFVAEMYGGGSFSDKVDVEFTSSSFGGTSVTLKQVKFDTSWTAGGRVGYWFKELGGLGAFGVGLDVFTFRANSDQQIVEVNIGGSSLGPFRIPPTEIFTVAIGFDLLRFRLHLAQSNEFQQGQIQPYVSLGPALFITDTTDGGIIFPANQSSTKTSLGVKAGAGLHVHINPTWSFFGEYRFTHFTSEATFLNSSVVGVSEITSKTDLNTHHVVGGLSFHF